MSLGEEKRSFNRDQWNWIRDIRAEYVELGSNKKQNTRPRVEEALAASTKQWLGVEVWVKSLDLECGMSVHW